MNKKWWIALVVIVIVGGIILAIANSNSKNSREYQILQAADACLRLEESERPEAIPCQLHQAAVEEEEAQIFADLANENLKQKKSRTQELLDLFNQSQNPVGTETSQP